VSPVRGIVLQSLHDQVKHQIFVFDSNKTPEDAAFLGELMRACEKKPNYTFVSTMTEMEKSSQEWHGEKGEITKPMLSKYIKDLSLPIYYIVGPKGLVSALRKTLRESGVDDANVREEEFSGY
jgi:ferredoxin-NADP reductase